MRQSCFLTRPVMFSDNCSAMRAMRCSTHWLCRLRMDAFAFVPLMAHSRAVATRTKGLSLMAIALPADFDYRKADIDQFEQLVRDAFQLNVENWARFRHVIGLGTDPARLIGPVVSDDLKDAYRELGKCHYEVVLSFGYCHFALMELNIVNPFAVRKAIKDFYFHGSVLLDNLARIIYIVNNPDAVSSRIKPKNGQTGDYVRHRIDRSDLIHKHPEGAGEYALHIDSPMIKEFCSVRNAMAHYWGIPFIQGRFWPRDHLHEKAFAWPHSEPRFNNYTGLTPVQDILSDHLKELDSAQHAVFGLLVHDIAKFEKNNQVTITELDSPTTPAQS